MQAGGPESPWPALHMWLQCCGQQRRPSSVFMENPLKEVWQKVVDQLPWPPPSSSEVCSCTSLPPTPHMQRQKKGRKQKRDQEVGLEVHGCNPNVLEACCLLGQPGLLSDRPVMDTLSLHATLPQMKDEILDAWGGCCWTSRGAWEGDLRKGAEVALVGTST